MDNINATPKTYTPRKTFYTLAQIAKFVRPGARRILLSGSTSPFQMLSFYHSGSGQLTITGINPDASSRSLSGTLANLPAITNLALYYTSSTTNLCRGATFPLTGGSFAATIPADCVFTLVNSNSTVGSVSVLLTNPPDGAVYAAPATIPIRASATTISGSISRVVFFNGTTNLGEDVTSPYSITWNNVPRGTYSLSASATNSLGNSGVSPVVRVTVVGPVAQISVSPANATVAPYATRQFTATALDALGAALLPQPPFSWSVGGGGSINSSGLFTAGGSVGGPFALAASAGGIAGIASVSVATNLNLAPAGVGYTWYSLTAPTDNSPRAAAPGINDGNLATDVRLLPGNGTDVTNAYEAAGVVWPAPQTMTRVLCRNGSYTTDENGVFADAFGLQFSPDGVTWTNAGAAWTLTPAYTYNSPLSANVSFTFTGGVATVRGVRCVGRVHTGWTGNSWFARATEVQAFAAAGIPQPVLSAIATSTNVIISWPAALTSYFLEAATNLIPTNIWSPVTNTPQPIGDLRTVTLPTVPARRFFRLHQQ